MYDERIVPVSGKHIWIERGCGYSAGGTIIGLIDDARHSRDVEEQLVSAGAQVVRTRIRDAAVLRSLLALGLVVLVEEALSPETLDVLAAAGIVPVAAASYQFTKTGDHNGE